MRLLLLVILSASFVVTTAQTKTVEKNKKGLPLCQMIRGNWYAEDDANVVLNFKGQRYLEMYGKDTTDNSNYVLSYSCRLQDRVRNNIYNLSKNVYVLFYKGNEVEQCNELLSLSNNVLSWRINDSGKIFIYKRTKKK